MLPLKPVKRRLKEQIDAQISNESITEARHFLERAMLELASETKREFVAYNQRRIRQGLRPRKRIPACVVQKASSNLLKYLRVRNIGSQSAKVVNPGGER
ncbi:MAG: hypothetical protein ACP5FL_08920 [Thermoplasmatota archaeon]